MTSENMFIYSTNFPETKHKIVVNDGRPIKSRAAIMALPGWLNANKFPSNPETDNWHGHMLPAQQYVE